MLVSERPGRLINVRDSTIYVRALQTSFLSSSWCLRNQRRLAALGDSTPSRSHETVHPRLPFRAVSRDVRVLLDKRR